MSIFIKDMKKPKSCDECPIALWGLPKDCKFVVEMCPIVEIKEPHGRLIDEDAHEYHGDLVYDTTVIEAEDE